MSRSVLRRNFCGRRKPLVSVITPTIKGREHYLAECRASVKGQTVQIHEHLTLLDDELVGCSATTNSLASSAKGDWLFILADDDLLLPRCLEYLISVSVGKQIVYSPPLVWGEDPAQFCCSPPNIPATALISKELWDRLGGYSLDKLRAEDNEFWCRAEMRAPVFERFDLEPTWIYRFHHDGVRNKSRC